MVLVTASASKAPTTCPISGLRIESRPEWTDFQISPNLIDSFRVMGGDILVTHPRGAASLEDVEGAIARVSEVVTRIVAPGRRFIWIADYRDLENIPLAGRWQAGLQPDQS